MTDMIPRAEADALVAAACEAAANALALPENGNAGPPQDQTDCLLDEQRRWDAAAIRALTPDDASAALEAMLAEARREERERCARMAKNRAREAADYFGRSAGIMFENLAAAIRKGRGVG